MAVDEAASALESPRGRDVRFCTNSAGDVGVEIETFAGPFDLRMRGIAKVDDQINLISSIIDSTCRLTRDHDGTDSIGFQKFQPSLTLSGLEVSYSSFKDWENPSQRLL